MADVVYRAKLGESANNNPTGTATSVDITAPIAGDTLVFSIGFRDTSTSNVTAVTFGSGTATLIEAINATATVVRRAEVWGLFNPGTATRVNYQLSEDVQGLRITVHAYTNVDSFGAATTTLGNSTDHSLTLGTNRPGSMVFAGFVHNQLATQDAGPWTPGAGDTERTDGNTSTDGLANITFTDLDTPATATGNFTISSQTVLAAQFSGLAIEIRSATVTATATGAAAFRSFPRMLMMGVGH